MRINNNIMAMNTHRQYTINNDNMAKATEKLSSGYRINRAGDDAAGLAISEKMRAQIRGLQMASKNSEDAISLVQTAEGALTETHSILQRMNELATQSASDTNETIDRNALQAEFTALNSEIDDIASKTAFNGKKLLDGSFGSTVTVNNGTSEIEAYTNGIKSITFEGFAVDAAEYHVTFTAATSTYTLTGGSLAGPVDFVSTNPAGAGTFEISFGANGVDGSVKFEFDATHVAFTDGDTLDFLVSGGSAKIQTGANAGDQLEIAIGDMDATALGVSAASIATQSDASSAITTVQAAINTVSTQRANLGAIQNRLEHKISNLDTSSENLTAAESRIRDIDMASEMTQYTQTNILVQAATSMLAQANAVPQNVLKLLG